MYMDNHGQLGTRGERKKERERERERDEQIANKEKIVVSSKMVK